MLLWWCIREDFHLSFQEIEARYLWGNLTTFYLDRGALVWSRLELLLVKRPRVRFRDTADASFTGNTGAMGSNNCFF